MSSGPDAGGGVAGRPGAVDGRDVDGLLQAVVAEVGAALGFWSVDLWTFSDDADTLVCRAWWCRDEDAPGAGSCVGAVVGLDQSHDLRRLVLAAEVVERHAGDDLSPADAAALAQAGFTSRIDVPLLAGAEVLGVLSLAAKGAVRRLSTEDRARLGSLARLAAAVLRAARLYESEADRAGRLVALLASGRGVSAALSVADIVAAVRDEAAGMIPGVACEAEVALRRDDGTYASAGPGRRSGRGRKRGVAVGARRRGGQAGRGAGTAGDRAYARWPRSAGDAAARDRPGARVHRVHRAPAAAVPPAGGGAGHPARGADRGGAGARAGAPRTAEPVRHRHRERPLQPLVLLRAALRRGRPCASLPGAARAGGRGGRPRDPARGVARSGVPRRRARGGRAARALQPARQGRRGVPPGRRAVRAPASQHAARSVRGGPCRRTHPRARGRHAPLGRR